ncbi:MAG: arginine repressor [Acidobacteria bacterium]|nr:arginine repressor [Acidobacteriota bacterium]
MYREKEQRQQSILDLVGRVNISSQENLRKRLGKLGFEVTQATLSRDLKDLNVVKTTSEEGEYKYAILNEWAGFQIFSCEVSGNLLVLHTEAGTAAIVAYRIDALRLSGVLGTVAGEDTLLVVVAEGHDARKVRKDLWKGVQAK